MVGRTPPSTQVGFRYERDLSQRVMQKTLLHSHIQITYPFIILAFSLCLLAIPVFAQADNNTSVINNVSVSATGNGQSYASVKTTINGTVVENWSSSSSDPITRHSQTNIKNRVVTHNSIRTTVDTDDKTATEKAIEQELINTLQALIQLYVTLYYANI